MSATRPERRRGCRAAPLDAGWQPVAALRPGVPIRILDINQYGALVECSYLLRPGRHAELQLAPVTGKRRVAASGVVERCTVTALTPLTFSAAIAFDPELEDPGTPLRRVAATQEPDDRRAVGIYFPHGATSGRVDAV